LDHNRTVTAFSGEFAIVCRGVSSLCEFAFPAIDLNRHAGVFPRTGALDQCPLIPLAEGPVDEHASELRAGVEGLAARLASRWELPVFLCDKSERVRREAELYALLEGGFGGLLDRNLNPDFGPSCANPRLGIALIGVRDFVIEFYVNLKPEMIRTAQKIAREIEDLRREGDSRFLGVRALGLSVPSQQSVQVALTATLPDLTPLDPVVAYVIERSLVADMSLSGTAVAGAIRSRDLPGATRFVIRPEQVVNGVHA
jgi:glutamate formiminotransferase